MFGPSVFIGIKSLVVGNDGVMDRLAEAVAEKLSARLPLPAPNVIGPSDRPAVAPRLLAVDDAATYLGRSRRSVEHLISDGKLPTIRSDRRVFLDRLDLDRWIDESKS